MLRTSSPIRSPTWSSPVSTTVSSISLCISSLAQSRLSYTCEYSICKRAMNSSVQCSSRQLKDLVYECQRQNHIDPDQYYQNAEAILKKLLECSFNDEGRRLQVSSGVVVDVAQLLVQNVLTCSLAHSHAPQLRYQIAKLLINLTYRSIDCKKTLCLQDNFVKTVCMLINENHELVRGYSDLLRNISWNADKEISLYLSDTVRPLANASVVLARRRLGTPNFAESRSSNSSIYDDEKTLKSVYSTLWNLALPSSKARETMCMVSHFLDYLIEWLQDHNCCPSLGEPVVGLTKCLVEQIYKLSAIELRYKYVKGLMNLVADQAGQPNAELTRNLLHALCLCLKYRNDEATNSLFYETYRFKHDLRRLLNKNELDQQSRNRIQELLRHVSYCSGLYKGRADQTPLQSPSFFNPPSFAYPGSSFTPQFSFAQSQRPKMPRTSFLSPNSASIKVGNVYAKPQSMTTPAPFTLTPPSHDSSMPSSADSKMGVGSRKHEDMKSSGYSETSMGSEVFQQQYQRHNQNPRFNFANEYAEPKKQAFIRNLHPTGLQSTQQPANWNSPTSSAISSMYENHDVILRGSNENFQASTSSQLHHSDTMLNQNTNYYQNEDTEQEDLREFRQFEPEFEQYGSHESLYCNSRSQYPSLTSLSTMPFCPSEKASPKSQNLSPINEDDINESDSASQRGILVEKNGSLNTTPRTTSTVGCKQKNDENRALNQQLLNQNLLNLQNLHLTNEEHEPLNQTF